MDELDDLWTNYGRTIDELYQQWTKSKNCFNFLFVCFCSLLFSVQGMRLSFINSISPKEILLTSSLLDFPKVRKTMDELVPLALDGGAADIKCWCYTHKQCCTRGPESTGKDSTELNLGVLGSPCVVS